VAQILKISAGYSPPPPEGFVSPMTWGVEENVIDRFRGAGVARDGIAFQREIFVFNFRGSAAAFVEAFKNYYGPTMNAFDAATKNGRADDLQRELVELFQAKNTSAREDFTTIPATFLLVTVSV